MDASRKKEDVGTASNGKCGIGGEHTMTSIRDLLDRHKGENAQSAS